MNNDQLAYIIEEAIRRNADRFKVHPRLVHNVTQEFNKNRTARVARLAALHECCLQGISSADLASAFNLDRSTVVQHLREYRREHATA